MKKLLISIFLSVAAVITADAEEYRYTKATAPSKSVYVLPENVTNISEKSIERFIGDKKVGAPYGVVYTNSAGAASLYYNEALGYIYPLAYNINLTSTGDGNGWSAESINLSPSWRFPSYTYASFGVNLGIDNIAGYGGVDDKRYAITIGTSNRAHSRHSYAIGSQVTSAINDSFALGYGITSKDTQSFVIGMGRRPDGGQGKPEKKFANYASMTNWLSKKTSSGLAVGVTFGNTNSLNSIGGYGYVITNVLSNADSNGFYAQFTEIPSEEFNDIFAGKWDWRYGKSHGKGTFNIVALGNNPSPGTSSPGMKAVYINDDCLYDLVTGRIMEISDPALTEIWQTYNSTVADLYSAISTNSVKYGPTLSQTQISSGVTYISNGYKEDGAISIGVDAQGNLSDTDVSSYLGATPIRNVGVAIGTRSIAEGATKTKNQSIAIGYCAHAKGSNAIAIGGGARHKTNETDETGNNAYASGATSIAIGYSTKASGEASLAIGAGVSNGNHTEASGKRSIAIGPEARATAGNAVQIGAGLNSVSNSLKFMDVTIVKDGKLVGATSDPKEIEITEEDIAAANGEISINIQSGSVATILPSTNLTPKSEIYVEAPDKSLRNYEVYFPNEPEVCAGLPVGFGLDELPAGIKKVIVNNIWQAHKLPARIIIKQPYSRLVIGEIVEFDDGTDWSPIITDANITYNSDTQKFITNGRYSLVGTNLHSGVSLKIAYPISASAVCTNDVDMTQNVNDQGIFSGTFYNYVMSIDYKVKTGQNVYSYSTGDTWVEFIYETKCGKRPAVFRKQFNMLGL